MRAMEERMTISAFARAAGVGIETVRYYQRRGILPRPVGEGIRHYGRADLSRLHFIRAAKQAGFTLDEIAELIDLDAIDDRARARAIAQARVIVLDAQIAALTASRDVLRRLADDCGTGRTGRCPILVAFET